MLPPRRGYITIFSGDLNPDLPTRSRFRPILDATDHGWAQPTPELLQAILDGLDGLPTESED